MSAAPSSNRQAAGAGAPYDDAVSPTRKFAITAALFACAVVLVFSATLVKNTGPLFAAWIPLLVVPYVLTRPEADERTSGQEPPTDGA